MTTDTLAYQGTADDRDTADEAATSGEHPIRYPYVELDRDPRKLRGLDDTGDNSRLVGDIRENRPDLVASVARHGVDPMASIINVTPDPDGALRVLVGFHRAAAAVAVKELENPDLTVPVLVHAPGTSRRDVLIAQGVENFHREGYTPAEEAGLYDQLALEGMDEKTIAEQLSRPIDRVLAGRTVAAHPRTHAASQALPQVDLLSMVHLAEFAEYEDLYRRLEEVLRDERPRNLEWELGRLRREREQRAELAAQSQRLADRGYTLIEDDNDLPGGTERVDELCTGQDLEPLDSAQHAGCPGRAAHVWVNRDLALKVVEYCVDYAEHGHLTIASMRIAAVENELRVEGVPIVDPDASGLTRLHDLYADRQAERSLTPAEHADCPGHAAFAENLLYKPTADVCFVCTDYAAHGHVLRTEGAVQQQRDAVRQSAERKRAGENNKQWDDAKTDRRAWLTEFFDGWRNSPSKSKANPKAKAKKVVTLPARVHHLLALAEVMASDYLADAAPAHRYTCTLLKLPQPQDNRREHNPLAVHLRKQATTERQAVIIRLAQIIGACEEHWDRGYTSSADGSWRRPGEDTRFYFELLAALGYPLSPVEQLINNPELDIPKWPHLAPPTEDVPLAA